MQLYPYWLLLCRRLKHKKYRKFWYFKKTLAPLCLYLATPRFLFLWLVLRVLNPRFITIFENTWHKINVVFIFRWFPLYEMFGTNLWVVFWNPFCPILKINWLRERSLMTSLIRVGRGVQESPKKGRYRVGQGRSHHLTF